MNGYSQFLIIQLAIAANIISEDEPYDLMWNKGGELLSQFEDSQFNIDTESEYDCIFKFIITKMISNENINDLMVTALEGGINYWCGKVRIIKFPENTSDNVLASDVISGDGELKLFDAESDDSWILTKDKFLNGVIKTLKWGNFESVEEMMDNHDAETADVLIQFALFDDIVFG